MKETAGALVERVIPAPTRDEQLDALRQAIRYVNSLGVTRVHSAGGDAEVLDLLAELRQQQALTLRMIVTPFINPPAVTPEVLARAEALRETYHDEWLNVSAVKFMLDGVIEAHTAAVLDPYANPPATTGTLNWDAAAYAAGVAEFDRRGFQIFTHAIGDRAIRVALDTYEATAPQSARADKRFRVEHIESPSAADIPRFGTLGVIASMQPLHATPGDNNLNVWAKAIGPERASRAWPWARLRGGGARLAFGSDWPVVTIDPWQGLRMLRTRQTLQGTPPGGWLPDERLTLEQAIEGYTIDAALRRPARGHRGVARTRQGRRPDRAVAGHHHGRARRDRQDHRRPDRGRRQSGARCPLKRFRLCPGGFRSAAGWPNALRRAALQSRLEAELKLRPTWNCKPL